MEWETLLAFGLLIVTLVSFLMEKVSVDTTALTLLGIILIFSGLEISENWPSGSVNPECVFKRGTINDRSNVCNKCVIESCRLIEQTSDYLGKFCKYGYRRFMLILLVLVAFVSAFVNNTPVVVVLLPVVISLSTEMGVSSQKC